MKKSVVSRKTFLFILLIFVNLLLPLLLLNHIVQNKSWVYTLTNDSDEIIFSIAISDDDNYIVVGSGNDNLYLFNKWSSIPIWTYKMNYDILCVDISSDGNFIIVGVENHKLYLFERNSPTPIWSCNLGAAISSVSISADGNNIIAMATQTYAFHKTSPNPLWTMLIPGNRIILSKDGKYFGIVSSTSINYFNFENTNPIWTYYAGNEVVPRIAISYNGNYLCAGGQDEYLHFFNNSVANPKIPMWSYKTNGLIRSVAISSDGKYCIAGTVGGIYAFEKSNPNPIFSKNLLEEILSVDISSDGQYFCAGGISDWVSEMGCIFLFNRENSTPIFTYSPEQRVGLVKIAANSNSFVASSGFKFYYIDRFNPKIMEDNELVLNAILISIWIFIGLDTLPGLIFTVKCSIIYIIKFPYRKIKKQKKEVEKIFTVLDKEFEKWEKEDPTRESKA